MLNNMCDTYNTLSSIVTRDFGPKNQNSASYFSTMCLESLRLLPQDTVGHTYASWLDREGVGPDTRDIIYNECAHVMQRYRERNDSTTPSPAAHLCGKSLCSKSLNLLVTILPTLALTVLAVARLKARNI